MEQLVCKPDYTPCFPAIVLTRQSTLLPVKALRSFLYLIVLIHTVFPPFHLSSIVKMFLHVKM